MSVKRHPISPLVIPDENLSEEQAPKDRRDIPARLPPAVSDGCCIGRPADGPEDECTQDPERKEYGGREDDLPLEIGRDLEESREEF